MRAQDAILMTVTIRSFLLFTARALLCTARSCCAQHGPVVRCAALLCATRTCCAQRGLVVHSAALLCTVLPFCAQRGPVAHSTVGLVHGPLVGARAVASGMAKVGLASAQVELGQQHDQQWRVLLARRHGRP